MPLVLGILENKGAPKTSKKRKWSLTLCQITVPWNWLLRRRRIQLKIANFWHNDLEGNDHGVFAQSFGSHIYVKTPYDFKWQTQLKRYQAAGKESTIITLFEMSNFVQKFNFDKKHFHEFFIKIFFWKFFREIKVVNS